MALNRIDQEALKRGTRRALASGLRWVADHLRDDDETVVTGEATQPAAPSPATAAPADEPERFGAAAYVDEQTAKPAAPPDDAALLGAMSGDMGPALAARAKAANETSSGSTPATPEAQALHDDILVALHTIFDPEIPVDIYELGLIYGVELDEDHAAHVTMTLTSPNCPAAQSLPSEVEYKVGAVEGVHGATVDVVFEPAWTPDLMSEEAKLELNIL